MAVESLGDFPGKIGVMGESQAELPMGRGCRASCRLCVLVLVTSLFPCCSALLPLAQKPAGAQGSKAAASQAQPELSTLHRIGTLTSTVSYHAYQQAARAIQHTKAKGQELALWIPGLVSAPASHIPAALSLLPCLVGISSNRLAPGLISLKMWVNPRLCTKPLCLKPHKR